MKRMLKAAGLCLLVLFLVVTVYVFNAFFGNPISALLADRAVREYLAANYAHLDVAIEKAGYSFKTADYYAHVASPTSTDTHFTVYMTMLGEVRYDTYDSVTSGWNTYDRLESAYRARTNALFDAEGFELRNDIAYGTLEIAGRSEFDYKPVPYGLSLAELTIDGEYDADELARTAGHIVFYMQDEDVSFETAARGMLRLKEILDENGIPFFALDFVLRLPREEGQPGSGGPSIHVAGFPACEIYEEGMTGRVQEAHEALEAFYGALDAKK